jgi:esterase/lipase superfamily enzyme
VGTPAKNAELSERRAVAVKKYLTQEGVEGYRVVPRAVGEVEPVASNATPPGRAQNRRADLVIGSKSEPPFAVVRVFYATDRRDDTPGSPAPAYGPTRGDGTLSYGTADVSIPRNHRMGEIERPTIWKLHFRENPTQDVVLTDVARENEGTFFSDISSRVGGSESKAAFVFVHGYNVSFADAVRRTAQISYDIGFDGAPILYSWPSRGRLAGYTIDENNVDWTEPHLRAFLDDLASRSGARTIHLIAHSMGNRALTRAFGDMMRDRGPTARAIFRDVVLAAPDIDADIFRTQIVPALVGPDTRVTLYASSRDRALLASKRVHQYARAGDAGHGLVLAPGIDTIDASSVDKGDILGHSYFSDNRSVLSDLFLVVRDGLEPARRPGLSKGDHYPGLYWTFRP